MKYTSIEKILQEMNSGLNEVVLILNASPSPRTNLAISQMTACKTQIWLIDELMVDPTKHVRGVEKSSIRYRVVVA